MCDTEISGSNPPIKSEKVPHDRSSGSHKTLFLSPSPSRSFPFVITFITLRGFTREIHQSLWQEVYTNTSSGEHLARTTILSSWEIYRSSSKWEDHFVLNWHSSLGRETSKPHLPLPPGYPFSLSNLSDLWLLIFFTAASYEKFLLAPVSLIFELSAPLALGRKL